MIATWEGGLVIDGTPRKGIPRARRWSGRAAYLVGPVDWLALLEELSPGDVVSGPAPGEVARVSIACHGGGSWELLPGAVWDLPWDPGEAAAVLEERRRAVDDAGLEWENTGSAVASSLWRSVHGRYRTIADPEVAAMVRDAAHPGPCVAFRGSLEDAEEVDLRSAYLEAMRRPSPESWIRARLPWSELRTRPGVVRARVSIAGGDLPPLPVRFAAWQHWPRGSAWGTWPIRWLRWAEREGLAEVRTVADAALCTEGDTLRRVAERIDTIADKPLRRICYTRGVGRHLAGRWWEAAIPERIDGSATRPEWHECPESRRKRPDWAMAVLTSSALQIVQRITREPRGSVALAHVDAIWIKAPADPDPDYATKARGPLRVYGVGTYRIGDKYAAQGVPSWEIPTLEAFEASIARREHDHASTGSGREWSSDPSTDPHATSIPITVRSLEEWSSGSLVFRDVGGPMAAIVGSSSSSSADVLDV